MRRGEAQWHGYSSLANTRRSEEGEGHTVDERAKGAQAAGVARAQARAQSGARRYGLGGGHVRLSELTTRDRELRARARGDALLPRVQRHFVV